MTSAPPLVPTSAKPVSKMLHALVGAEPAPEAAPPAPAHAPAPPPAPAPVAAPAAPPAPTPALAPTPPAAAAPPPLDLSSVEALADLPEDARDAFARAAVIHSLGRDEEVSGFALALVVSGSVDLAATIVDAMAQRLETGAMIRARGTVDASSPMRLVTASETCSVAVWDEDAVTEAFRTCPWVEDDLRSAGDRFQALVGITMGPLGERLDASLRASVTDRLKLLTLAEHEVFATRGQAIRGLLVVGAGELELVAEDGNANGTVIRPGDFLFPNEVLRAAPAPETVRAAKGGAIILLAERQIAQELLMTCPPLLEIFAG